MNDKDIIKALECCTLGTFACTEECPCFYPKRNLKINSCRFELLGEVLDLINRQRTEIERLEKHTKKVIDNCRVFTKANDEANNKRFLEAIEVVKIEAIKEFAERLKEEATVDDDSTWWVANIDIDNLVKEMTEGKE